MENPSQPQTTTVAALPSFTTPRWRQHCLMFKTNCWVRLHNTLSPAIVLLLLVWITPTAAEPTSYNDPFHAIALRAPRPADPPICCLKPLPPLEPVEDDLLLSFEEWKARQHHTSENASSTSASGGSGNESGNGQGNGSESLKVEDATSPPPAAQEDHQPHAPAQTPETIFQLPPHFRVPLVDRFNYASLDCSARVHKAHKGAKHPANILSSKKDRYMLSPCKTKEQQFVVIELCEDIRIDTVQLANFEFFSGVFKDITVSVAKTSSEEENWTVAGSWKAKNVRGVQVRFSHTHKFSIYSLSDTTFIVLPSTIVTSRILSIPSH